MVDRRRMLTIIIIEFVSLAIIALIIYVMWAGAAPAPMPLREPPHPSVPDTISYQGRIDVSGSAFDGLGRFKFAIVKRTGAVAYWTNDGTGMDTAPFTPTDHITLTVTDGLFSVLLGDTTITGMLPITASAFTYYGTALRVWFDDGVHGWEMLTPDTLLASVPYAFVAEESSHAIWASGALTSVYAITSTWSTTATAATTAITATWATTATAATTAVTATWATTANYALASPGGGGTITQVVAGTGLNGGGTSGAVTVTLNTSVTLTALNADTITSTGGVNVGTSGGAASGNLRYSGNLQPGRNSTYYTGYAFVPLGSALMNSGYDGDAIAASAWLTLTSLFNVPAGAKAIAALVTARDETVGVAFCLGPDSSNYMAVCAYTQVANYYANASGIVPCDANGNVYLYLGSEVDNLYVRIWGYFI